MAAVGKRLGFPCVMKPPCQGSSVGISIPSNVEAFRKAFPDVMQYGTSVMVEQFVKGTEVTCAVLEADDSKPAMALPVTEIRPVTSAYFDYEAKYTPGASLEITPAEIAPEVAAEVQAMAVRVHEIVGCGIWSRSDFMIGPDGPVWIEVNTIPGMTPTSLFPQGAAAIGISYPQFIQKLIEAAIARHERGRERL